MRSKFELKRGHTQTVCFDWCIVSHTTVCKHPQVYYITLLPDSTY